MFKKKLSHILIAFSFFVAGIATVVILYKKYAPDKTITTEQFLLLAVTLAIGLAYSIKVAKPKRKQ